VPEESGHVQRIARRDPARPLQAPARRNPRSRPPNARLPDARSG